MKKISHLFLLFVSSLCLSSCVKDSVGITEPESASETKSINAYFAEPLLVPHKMIHCDAVFSDVLYYIGSDSGTDNEISFAKLTLVKINLAEHANDDSGTTTLIPLDIPIPNGTKLLSIPQMMLAVGLEGDIHIFVYQYYNDRLPVELASVYWHRLDENGELLKTLDLSGEMADGGVGGIYDFVVDGMGNVFIATGGYGSTSSDLIHVIMPNGEMAFTLDYDGIYVSLFLSGHGVGILYRGEAGDELYMAEIDLGAQSLAGLTNLDIEDAKLRSADIEGNILFFADQDAVFDYDLAHNLKSARFTWPDLGIVADGYFVRVFSLAGKRVLFTDRYPYDQIPYKLIRPMTDDEIAKAAANQLEEISVITVALNGTLENHVKPIVTAYNMANPDKQVKLVNYFDDRPDDPNMSIDDYWEWGFKEKLDEATLNLELDIIRGQGPDIVISRNSLPLHRYARMGIFEDLYPYLEADPFFNWEDYHEHLIRAYEIEGALYGIPMASFYKALIVRQSDIQNFNINGINFGNKSGWSLDELIAFVDNFGFDQMIFNKPTKTAVLDLCLYANGDILVDWNSQEVEFNRDFISKILEFSNRFIDEDKYSNDTPLDLRAQNGEIKIYSPMLTEYCIPGTLNSYSSIMGEPVSYIGFPSENGSGIITHSEYLVSLTAGCRDKEAAWHFISYYLAERLVTKDSGKEWVESLKSSETMTFSDSRLSTSYSFRIDDNEIAAYLDLNTHDVQIRIDDQIIENIIKEEAGIYFNGGKSLDEVVDVIENRVSLYVNEVK